MKTRAWRTCLGDRQRSRGLHFCPFPDLSGASPGSSQHPARKLPTYASSPKGMNIPPMSHLRSIFHRSRTEWLFSVLSPYLPNRTYHPSLTPAVPADRSGHVTDLWRPQDTPRDVVVVGVGAGGCPVGPSSRPRPLRSGAPLLSAVAERPVAAAVTDAATVTGRHQRRRSPAS